MRILFITATRIGDAVISTGLLRHLVDKHPNAKITVACGPLAVSLFAGVPGLEKVIPVPKKKFGGHWLKLWNDVRGHHWDIVIDLRRSLLSYFIRTSERLRLGPDDNTSHRVTLLSGLLGLDPPADPKIWFTQSHLDQAAALLASAGSTKGPVVCLCPVAARSEKIWPAERFVELSKSLLARDNEENELRLVLIGSEDDRSVVEDINAHLPTDRVTTLLGSPDLLFVGAVLSRSSLTIANDSGLAHLAAAADCPTIALFGPTRDDLYRPWGPKVEVICASEGSENRSMTDISVGSVLQAANTFLA